MPDHGRPACTLVKLAANTTPFLPAAYVPSCLPRSLPCATLCQVFDLPRWQEHRSTQRYMRYMDRLFTSRIAKGLLGPMSYVASMCISVGTYHTLIDQEFIQNLAPGVSEVRAAVRQGCAWACSSGLGREC